MKPYLPFLKERTPSVALPRELDRLPPFDEMDRAALHALRDGRASDTQQQRALGWVLFAAGDSDFHFRGESAHETAYALGRSSVARAIRAVLQTRSLEAKDTEQGV